MSRIGLTYLVRKNLFRRPFRNGILVLCVAAVVGLQVAAGLIDQASRYGLELGLKRLGADLVAVPRGLDPDMERAYMTGEPALFYMDRALQNKISAQSFVEQTSAQVFIRSLSGASCCSAWNLLLIGFEPETDFTIRPWLADHAERPLGPDDILVGAGLDVEPGAQMKFFGHPYHVAGVLEATGMGLDLTVLIPIAAAYRMAAESSQKAEQPLELKPDKISAVMIRLKPEKEGGLPLYKAAYELERALPEISVIQPDDLMLKMQRNISGVLHGLRSAGYSIWPVAALLIGLVFAMAVNERKREIGILRAMGATRSYIFRMIIAEVLIVAGTGTALGLSLSVGLLAAFSRYIAASLAVPFHWPRPDELIVILLLSTALALGTGVIAALYPALRISRMEPYAALRGTEQ